MTQEDLARQTGLTRVHVARRETANYDAEAGDGAGGEDCNPGGLRKPPAQLAPPGARLTRAA